MNKRFSGAAIFTLVCIVLITLNLRSPLTAVGPVLYEIIEKLSLTSIEAGLITTIPLLAFGGLSIFAPKLSEKIGIEYVLWYSMLVLIAGLLIRVSGSMSMLLVGAGLIGVAIAMGNVLMPAFIKLRFSENMGLVTGIYALSMNVTGAFASAFSIRIGEFTGYGWKGSLGVWVITAAIAFIFWISQLPKRKEIASTVKTDTGKGTFSTLFKSPLAWYITVFMGLQSCLFYVFVAWLPVVLQDWGMTKEEAGWTFSYIQLTQLPITLIGPILTARIKKHSLLIAFTSAVLLIGIFGLVFFQLQFVVISVVCIGIGTGLAFSIVMMLFVLKTKTAARAAQLSGMAQSFGYLIAATSPPLFGYVHDVSGGWISSLIMLIFVTVAMCIVGLLASRKPGYQIE